MRAILNYLEERRLEFKRHFLVAKMLESRLDEALMDDLHIEVRHINTVKSGLLVHLYNIVEAVATRILKRVGEEAATELPNLWTEEVRTEWLRAKLGNIEQKSSDKALKHITELSGILVSGEPVESFTVKSMPGNWDNKDFEKVAQRLGCELDIPPEIKRKAYEPVYRNNQSAFKYLARRRNDLAHGNSTFEEGAHDLTLNDVEALADRVLPYLIEVTRSYEIFLENKGFLKNGEDAA